MFGDDSRPTGATIDIHGGGGDLVFPHHENEIAQSQAANGKPLANYWLHNGMVTVNGEKMSKSLGNFTTIRDLLEGHWAEYPQPVDPMAVRLFVLQGHYRKPLDFTKDAIAAAINSLANPEGWTFVWRSPRYKTGLVRRQPPALSAGTQPRYPLDGAVPSRYGR